jgi:sodium/hydrogen antiporter
MSSDAILIVLVSVFVWGLVSARLERADFTAPVVFMVIGASLGATGVLSGSGSAETLKPLVEVTLVWVLFSDAAGVPFRRIRGELGRYARLLGVSLPLTVLLGWGLAAWLFPGLGLWLALLVGAALAPTDAALGLPVVSNKAVPSRIRRLLTVESGLNDGIATPVVMLAIAGAASAEGIQDAPGVGAALLELGTGVLVGTVLGLSGGWLLRRARAHGLAAEEFCGVAVLALALLAYVAAVAVSGNGFVAAFCGGLAFGAAAGRRGPAELVFLEQTSGLLSLLVWLAFGAIAWPVLTEEVDILVAVYAVLSLTVVRMAPVAIASVRSGLERGSIVFIGWFGPRGLASLVFALLALEELGPDADRAVTIIGATVLLSVLAHGFSAAPLAARYARTQADGVSEGRAG